MRGGDEIQLVGRGEEAEMVTRFLTFRYIFRPSSSQVMNVSMVILLVCDSFVQNIH